MPRTPVAGALFQRLWAIWPKKVSPESSRKALEVLIKTEDVDYDRLLLCAEAYLLKQDSRYIHDLGNWIRGNVWKDYYLAEPESIIAAETALLNEARRLLASWRESKRKWWLDIADEEGIIEDIKCKLQERFFRENWEQALRFAVKLFSRRRQDKWRSLIPSLRWFISGDTVARLVEGEYGVIRERSRKPQGNFVPNEYTPEPLSERALQDIGKQVEDFMKRHGLEDDNERDRSKKPPSFF